MNKSSELHVHIYMALTSLPDAVTWDEMSDCSVVPSGTVAMATEPPDFKLRVIIAIPAIQQPVSIGLYKCCPSTAPVQHLS